MKRPPRHRLPQVVTGVRGAMLALILACPGCDRHAGGHPATERRLIVSTDDAGMCESVNAASIAGLESGVVTSTSIIVPGPTFRQFAAYAVAHPEFDYGVHLALTCDVPEGPWGPVLLAADVPPLVDKSGHFWPTTDEVARHAKLEEVERELRAQIDAALASGIRITHLDHHMFVLHCRPDLVELYAMLAIDYGLPARLLSAPPDRLTDEAVRRAYQGAADRVARAGLPLLDAVLDDNYAVEPERKRAFHLESLRRLRPGLNELVIHCAFADARGVPPPHVDRRDAETRFLVSVEAREELRRQRIRQTTWGDLLSPDRAARTRQPRSAGDRRGIINDPQRVPAHDK